MFIDTYFVKSLTQKDFIVPESKDLIYFSNNKALKRDCHSDLKLCLIGLLDGRTNKDSISTFDKHIRILESSANSKLSKHIEFGWVNATCQTNFSAHFNAHPDNLPGVIALIPKAKKYAIMYGSFEKENINGFVDRILNGKMHLDDFDNDKIYLKNAINCLEIKEEEVFVSDR